MPRIVIETLIEADAYVVFDLARSVDLHKLSAQKTNEEAVGGRTVGLMELGETVTWRARHLGFYQKLTSKLVEMDRPFSFKDEMVKGAFKSFIHEHKFKALGDGKTMMVDVFEYQSPLGILGRFADKLFLEQYMTKFLKQRNAIIKQYAEMKS
jgi:ligand-binding SRPBCC domain-containing protein